MAGLFLIALIVVPLVELWLLIVVGGLIGALPTVAIVVVTAIIGSQLVRRQGTGVLRRIQATQARGEIPALPMVNGLALLMGGFLLLVPGLITDTCGFLLLIPRLRERIARYLLSKVKIRTPFGSYQPFDRDDDDDDDVIEGEYERRKREARGNLRDDQDHKRRP